MRSCMSLQGTWMGDFYVYLHHHEIVTDYMSIASMMSSKNLREILRAAYHVANALDVYFPSFTWKIAWRGFWSYFWSGRNFRPSAFPWPFGKVSGFSELWRFAASFLCRKRNWCNLDNFSLDIWWLMMVRNSLMIVLAASHVF